MPEEMLVPGFVLASCAQLCWARAGQGCALTLPIWGLCVFLPLLILSFGSAPRAWYTERVCTGSWEGLPLQRFRNNRLVSGCLSVNRQGRAWPQDVEGRERDGKVSLGDGAEAGLRMPPRSSRFSFA